MRGEFALIEKLRRLVGKPGPGVVTGIGDDAAVVELEGRSLLTVDMQAEGVHFRLDWITPEELGHRALAVNLSDIAAMGGAPRFALVSLGVREGIDDGFLEAAFGGLLALARRHGVQVVGGNVSRTDQLIWDVTVLGTCPGVPKGRRGARVGDLLMITGEPGRAAAGRKALETAGPEARRDRPDAVAAFLRPEPRVREGIWLGGRAEVTACIDVSDGLVADLHHVARASKVGFCLEKPLSEDALFGGEDYELCFTVAPAGREAAERELGAIRLGRVVPEGEGIRLGGRVLPDRGWDHLESRGGGGS